MTKKLILEITPSQARALVWAMNSFESTYLDETTGFDDIDAQARRAERITRDHYIALAEFAEANGK